ncbi:hypothetical protein G7K_2070-t1 [Saitoella complicata NRRL Y-17804]|uniref:Mitochondrial pyruvate carrier n=1 Tax=Saitoella complicata (strain BCRC 22490 / CBS 7301 / JCM 7358 / NBRC 10748 / NRRL Y-17804) TaxID=698492 RepID=A0A0E9NDH0_SAICN|nr:hypothetical protein G7K_2070-t1 [Saitoella complicata NRRL Y-17804]
MLFVSLERFRDVTRYLHSRRAVYDVGLFIHILAPSSFRSQVLFIHSAFDSPSFTASDSTPESPCRRTYAFNTAETSFSTFAFPNPSKLFFSSRPISYLTYIFAGTPNASRIRIGVKTYRTPLEVSEVWQKWKRTSLIACEKAYLADICRNTVNHRNQKRSRLQRVQHTLMLWIVFVVEYYRATAVGIYPSLLSNIMAAASGASRSAFSSFWNGPTGPRTVHFWAPVMKWGLVIAGASDFARPAEQLSLSQNAALVATGTIWTRWSMIIKPKNMM